MFLDSAIRLNMYLDSLQEPQRFYMFLLVYAGLPILCIILWFVNDIIEEKKKRKKEEEERKRKWQELIKDM